jgi:lipopolysaccharide export system protein LptC
MPGTRYIVVIAVLTAGVLGSWYISRQGRSGEEPPPADVEHRGYYLRSARILGTGPDGELLYEIRAEHAEQVGDGRVDFTTVSVSYSPDSAVPWTVDADAATIEEDGRRVTLRGHVRAVSQEGFSGNDTEIRTSYLELLPDDYLAETEDRVQIRIGERSLTATGMLASLKDNTLELKSNVSGKFVP